MAAAMEVAELRAAFARIIPDHVGPCAGGRRTQSEPPPLSPFDYIPSEPCFHVTPEQLPPPPRDWLGSCPPTPERWPSPPPGFWEAGNRVHVTIAQSCDRAGTGPETQSCERAGGARDCVPGPNQQKNKKKMLRKEASARAKGKPTRADKRAAKREIKG